jgi:hypothetical protein
VGKTIPEVQKAYLAGFIDGDEAIMALLERHPAKRFGFRVRIWVNVKWLLEAIQPFARVKALQIGIALTILEHRIESIEDLQVQAEWADTLAALNVRSRGRRQNTAAMIQGFVSRND